MSKTAGSREHKPTHEEIAARARAIYEESGRVPGRDLQNWLQAETELMRAKSAAPREVATSGVTKHTGRPASPKTSPTPQSYAS